MKYKELYLDGKNRQACDVTGIKEENVMLESKPIEKIKNNWIIILGFVVIVIGLLLIKFNPLYFAICMVFMLLTIGLFIIGNKYSVKCNKDALTIKQQIQTFNIPYKSVKNVFIEKSGRILFRRSYVLVIRCEDQLKFLREFELPLLCCNIEEVAKFIDNFRLAGQNDPATISYNKRRSLKRIVNFAFTIVCAILIAWFCFANGIIKLPQ